MAFLAGAFTALAGAFAGALAVLAGAAFFAGALVAREGAAFFAGALAAVVFAAADPRLAATMSLKVAPTVNFTPLPAGTLDRGAGAGVPGRAGLALRLAPAAETGEGHLLALLHRQLHGVDERLDDLLDFRLTHGGLACDLVHQLGLVHNDLHS